MVKVDKMDGIRIREYIVKKKQDEPQKIDAPSLNI
jgi:hypothetical protein